MTPLLLALTLALPGSARDAQAIVLRLGAPWCAPCLEMEPAFHGVARSLSGWVSFVQVDATEDRGAARALGVHSLPATAILWRGRLLELTLGYLTAGEQLALGLRAALLPIVLDALGPAPPES